MYMRYSLDDVIKIICCDIRYLMLIAACDLVSWLAGHSFCLALCRSVSLTCFLAAEFFSGTV